MIAAFPSEIHTLFPFKSFKFIPERNRSQATNASQWFSLQVHIVVQNLKLPFVKSWTNSSLTQVVIVQAELRSSYFSVVLLQ